MKLLIALLLAATPSPPPDATTTQRGLVNTKAQAFSGLKTFDGGLWTSTLNDLVPGPSTSEVSLHIAPNGSNANPCSAAAPCASLNGAFARIPRILRHKTFIWADAGTYATESTVLEGFRFEQFGGIEIIGQPRQILALDGGTVTGTLTGVSNTVPFPTVTDTGQAWVVNALRGTHVRITSGSASGNVGVVWRNTATQLQLVGTIAGTVAVGNTYELIEPDVTFVANQTSGADIHNSTISIRNIQTRPATSPTLGGYDGGTYGAVVFTWVRLQQAGNTNSATSFSDVGGRISLNNSLVEAGVNITGPVNQLAMTQTVVRAKTASSAFNSSLSSGTALNGGGLLGPVYFDCSGSTSVCFTARTPLNFASTTNYVVDSAATSSAMLFTGVTMRPTSSFTNASWLVSCSSASAIGVWMDSSSSNLNNDWNSATIPSLVTLGCGTGLKVSGSGSNVGVFSSQVFDAGTAFVAERGAHLRLSGNPSLSFTNVTNELQIDGTNYTVATLNAASPQVLPTAPNAYGTWISR